MGWIRAHYTLEENFGLGLRDKDPQAAQQGLYYYYHTFAKALDAMDQDVFIDSDGVQHNWRAELVEELARRQWPDGFWSNDTARWLEGDPNLVTGYALLALSYCAPKANE